MPTMQPARNPRSAGSFSPLPPPPPPPSNAAAAAAVANSTAASGVSPTPFDHTGRAGAALSPATRPRRSSTTSSDDSAVLSAMPTPLNISKTRQPPHYHHAASGTTATTPTTAFASAAMPTPPSTHSNFSRPTPGAGAAAVAAAAAARQLAAASGLGGGSDAGLSIASGKTLRAVSPLTLPGTASSSSISLAAGPASPTASLKPVTSSHTNHANHANHANHLRRHSQAPGLFDATLPSMSGAGSLSQVIKAQQQQQPQSPSQRPLGSTSPLQPREMSASQIAAQTAVLHHKQAGSAKLSPQQHQQLQQAQHSQLLLHHDDYERELPPTPTPTQQQHPLHPQSSHVRQRSQTVPVIGETYEGLPAATAVSKRNSGGPLAPPILSLTEASAPRESGFGQQTYHNGLLGSHTAAAQTAASVVFSRSGAPSANTSPKMQSPHSPKQPLQQQMQQMQPQPQLQLQQQQQQQQPPLPLAPPPLPPPVPDKNDRGDKSDKKAEKSKGKLFSRPGKITTKLDVRDRPLPSPSKMGIGSALASLQRANFSTTSLDSSAPSFYNLNNSSAATIRAGDGGGGGGGGAATSGSSLALGLGLTASSSSLSLVGGTGGSSGSTSAAPSFVDKDARDGRDSRETARDGVRDYQYREGKEKKHHFLSRQKHKLKDKDEFHLPLSSAASNSRPTDPNAPSSLYNFSLPPNSPGPGATSFKSKSGLDLRHGARGLKKKDDRLGDDFGGLGGLGVGIAMGGGSSLGLAGGSGGGGGSSGGAVNSSGGAGGITGTGGGTGAGSVAGSHHPGDWAGPGSFGAGSAAAAAAAAASVGFGHDGGHDGARYVGSSKLSLDDAWPYLKAKLQVIFEGEDLRIPVEQLNQVVVMHIQYCIQRRSPNIILEDLRDLLSAGFASLDRTLRQTPEDRLIPALVELWIFTFTSILPYMQAVFLPLDLEFAGAGTLLTPEQARDFWGGVAGGTATYSTSGPSAGIGTGTGTAVGGSASTANVAPVSAVLDVRRLVLASYRDTVILPRYDTLKPIFSRLSLDFLPQTSVASLTRGGTAPGGLGLGMGGLSQTKPIPIQQRPGRSNSALTAAGQSAAHSFGSFGSLPPLQPPPPSASLYSGSPGTDLSGGRPGTAMSLDPATSGRVGVGADSASILSGSRSRAISNVSFGSGSEPRPSFSSSVPYAAGGGGGGSTLGTSVGTLGSVREQNVEDSKQVTDMVGRMLQCMSVLAGVGVAGDGHGSMVSDGVSGISGDEGNRRVEELSRLLKLNWLGRGRTGRNRRGMVGGRVKRGAGGDLSTTREGLQAA